MVKFKRTINSLWLIICSFCLLIGYDTSFAFFKPQWLNFSHEEKNFWAQMSKDFAIEPYEQNPHIQQQIRWYQQHPRHLRRILKGAEPFIHYVYEQTRKNNLPAELALIPLIESQYNPTIGAKSGATGLWQMMPGTARKFGLKINQTYDGRRDITASTKAALTYLTYLYHYFNKDWLLALAAYDAGEGTVRSRITRHTDFWKMPFSKETREYVPKLLAIASIIRNPQIYQIPLPSINNEPTLQEITWSQANVINVTQTAKNLGVDDQILKKYNPGIRKNVATVPRSITLLLPTNTNIQQPPSSDSTFEAASDNSSPTIQVPKKKKKTKSSKRSKKYTIQSKDTLSSIAKRFHVPIKQLEQANPLKKGKILKIGDKLTIPK